jgi:hypothetical protein
VVVDERFDGVDQSFTHLVDLVEDEEGLRTVCDVPSNPVLQIKLVYDKQSIKTFLKNYFFNKTSWHNVLHGTITKESTSVSLLRLEKGRPYSFRRQFNIGHLTKKPSPRKTTPSLFHTILV